MTLETIAVIHTEFPAKFGIPRQSGLVDGLRGMIVFEPAWRVPEAVRGLELYSHIWLLWGFSQTMRDGWSPTVRPPRLGGNRRVGVFASRSPFRPNAIGLSSVRLLEVRSTPTLGTVLLVAGADLMDGTPIYDIKPYLPFTDSHPEASCGYAAPPEARLRVECTPALLAALPEEHRAPLLAVLGQDPRPAYQEDGRVYAFTFAGYRVCFTVAGDVATVCEIAREEQA